MEMAVYSEQKELVLTTDASLQYLAGVLATSDVDESKRWVEQSVE